MIDRSERRRWMDQAEAASRVADSQEVRRELLRRVKRGEITLAESQAELRKIKRLAKSHGLITRNQAWNGQ